MELLQHVGHLGVEGHPLEAATSGGEPLLQVQGDAVPLDAGDEYVAGVVLSSSICPGRQRVGGCSLHLLV